LPPLFADMTENVHKFFTAVNHQQACPSTNPAPQEPPKKDARLALLMRPAKPEPLFKFRSKVSIAVA